MAYDEGLAERIGTVFPDMDGVVEKKMFGGLAFMVNGNMCVGVIKDLLMARVGPDQYSESLTLPGTSEMDFTGRVMKGMVFVDQSVLGEDEQLKAWILRCLQFTQTLPPK